MPYRKTPLANEEVYHVFTKSIAGFRVFNSPADFERILKTIVFYNTQNPSCKLSLSLKKQSTNSKPALELGSDSNQKIVKIIAYCIMPTHIHMILQQLKDGGISRFMNIALKSYSKYFNIKHVRKGPLWEGRFKNVLVETDEQFLHLTRYIHLNPLIGYVTKELASYRWSSYSEYLGLIDGICLKDEIFGQFKSAKDYEQFVLDQADYARVLDLIKHNLLDSEE